MHSAGLILSAAMAMTASAVPFEGGHSHSHYHSKNLQARHALGGNGSHFPIHIINQCDASKGFAVYQITADYDLLQITPTKTIDSGESGTIHAPYLETGLRLSANAGDSSFDQWSAQALFEFGYAGSIEGSQDGLAYDISMMSGSDESIGLHIAPIPNGSGSESCESKTCSPSDCPADQGWTNADQDADGSPADTVCYMGRTAMLTIWCPTTTSINSTSSS